MKEKSRILVFVVLLFGISILNILTTNKSFSERENRFLAQLPKINIKTILSGEFNQNFDKYASDQFIMRDSWTGLKTRLDLTLLKRDNERVYFGKDDYLFDVEKEINHKHFNKNMDKLNQLSAEINRPLDVVLVPTKSTIYPENLPYKAPLVNERELLNDIRQSLNNDINLFSMIETFTNKKEEVLYYKTDHHYTSLGAYYTYKDYIESIGLVAHPIDEFERKIVNDDFLGTLYRKSNYYSGDSETIEKFNFKENNQVEIIVNKTDELESLYDESYLSKADKYSYFLGGDHPLLEIATDKKNKGTIVILKDSFANSMIPFLTLHFEKIIVIDQRYFNLPIKDFLETIDYDRVLYLFNLRTFYDG